MERIMSETKADVRLRWLTPEEGGRKFPPHPSGQPYATTAYFHGDSLAELFSVVLRFTAGGIQQAELRLLASDKLPDIAARLTPGTELHITEGPRTVAECQIVSVRHGATV
jgi:hypothetical protein